MQMSPVSFRSNLNFTSKKSNIDTKTTSGNEFENLKNELKKEGIEIPKFTPVQSGLIAGGSWFTIGFLIDRLLGLFSKSLKTPIKLSLAINGAIGLAGGISSYFKAKKQNEV